MHLAIDGRFLTQPMTGVQRYARDLCTALDQSLARRDPHTRGVQVTVIAPRSPAPLPTYQHLEVVVTGPLMGHAWEQLVLPIAARRHDVLFCPGNVAPIMTLRTRPPVVVTVHDLAFRYHPETVSPAFRRGYEVLVPAVMRGAARIITVSEAERARMLEHFPEASSRLVAIANGGPSVAAARDQPTAPDSPGRPRYLLYVGALNERKNISGVVAATRLMLSDDPTLSAVFIGSSASAFTSVELGASHDRIHVLGHVDDATLARYYAEASVLLFPSFHEASGLPPIEAMAHGCPVVVSDIEALRERCGSAAVYCDPHSVDSIVSAATRVLRDPDLQRDLRKAGRARASTFTWDRCMSETIEVLRQAAGG